MLAKGKSEREPPPIHRRALPHGVEHDAEHGAVDCVDNEPKPAVPEADEPDVGIIAAEQPLIDRLQQSPNRRRRRTRDGRTLRQSHATTVLERCQKETPSTAQRAACRRWWETRWRSRRRIRARR